MFKAIILLYRRDDMTHADFRRWWLDDHAPLARQLPGCRRLVFNLLAEAPDAAPDAAPDVSADGISELWFDSRAAFDAAYATELGRRVAADSTAHVRSRLRLFVEEHVQVAGGPAGAGHSRTGALP